jgi:hypothetical protein
MADELFFAINVENSVLHLARRNDLLAHLGSEGAEFEIYDSLGRQWKIVESGGERSVVPVDEREPGPSDKQLLLDRITCACARIQLRVDRDIDPPPKGERVPVVQAALNVVLAALGASAIFELPPAGPGGQTVLDDRRGPYHNRTVHGSG